MANGKGSPKLSERAIEHQILTYLFKLKIGLFWKNVTTGYFDGKSWRKQASIFAINGVPDILGIVNGRFVGIEVKAKGGRLSAEQEAFARKAQALGAVCFCARSVQEVHQALVACGLLCDSPDHAPAI